MRDLPLGEHVVLHFTTGLQGSGLNVTVDNFFASLSLARNLLKKQMTMVGTMRKNRREIPADLTVPRNRELHSSIFCYTPEEGIQLVSYKAKNNKVVLLCSSQHNTNDIVSHANKKPSSHNITIRQKGVLTEWIKEFLHTA
jgi:hypothetical protein